MNSVIAKIKNLDDSLTNSERKIAKFVVSDPKSVLKMTLSEFAHACEVSEATAVRFIRKIGFDTFQAFKFAIFKEDIVNKSEIDDIYIVPEDSPSEVLKKITAGTIRTIQNTANITDLSEYVKLAHSVRSARRIEIYGVGSSGAVALFAQYKLTRSGYSSVAITDPHMQCISAATLNSKDLVIAISQSGSTRDTVDSLEIAKNHGVTTAAITDHRNSPLTKHADLIIETLSSETPIDTSAGRSVIAQIFAIELLTGILHILDYEYCKKAGDETAKAVLRKLY